MTSRTTFGLTLGFNVGAMWKEVSSIAEILYLHELCKACNFV